VKVNIRAQLRYKDNKTISYHLSVSQVNWWCTASSSGLNRWTYFIRWHFNRSSRPNITSGVSVFSEVSAVWGVKVPRPDSLAEVILSASWEECMPDKLPDAVSGTIPDSPACGVTSPAAYPSNWMLDSAASHKSEASANCARHRSNLLTSRSLQTDMKHWMKKTVLLLPYKNL